VPCDLALAGWAKKSRVLGMRAVDDRFDVSTVGADRAGGCVSMSSAAEGAILECGQRRRMCMRSNTTDDGLRMPADFQAGTKSRHAPNKLYLYHQRG
jgi:hypothetical protein